MPESAPPTVQISGVEFTREEIFNLVGSTTGPGWRGIARLLEAWKAERLEDLLLRHDLPGGVSLTDHLLLTAGRTEMLAVFATLPEAAEYAHEELKAIEEER